VCGRAASTTSRDRLAELLHITEVEAPELPINYNVAPTQDIYVAATASNGERKLRALRWGLVPHWAKDPRKSFINARAETVADKPAFRSSIRSKRALCPLDGYYEWWRPPAGVKAAKQPYYFGAGSATPLAVAALYDLWHDAEGKPWRTVSLITTAANATMAPVHSRMPVILAPETWDEWLRPGPIETSRLDELLVPAPNDLLVRWPVSSAVNSAKNNGPELIEPLRAVPVVASFLDEEDTRCRVPAPDCGCSPLP
jgi:putative SOS response-associated peptidase YedK